MFGSKALLAEKDARIADLKAEIANLRSMLTPTRTPAHLVPLLHMEADAVINNTGEVVEVTSEQRAEYDAMISERDRLLSGTY